MGYCDAGALALVSSEALVYEMEQNALAVRKEHAQAVLAKATVFVMGLLGWMKMLKDGWQSS
jgi:hypothetical protein